MDCFLRRRNLGQGEGASYTETFSLTGTGANVYSTYFDATAHDAYWIIPYIDGEPKLSSNATSGGGAVKVQIELFSDSAHSNLVGYYQPKNGVIYSSSQTGANSSQINFDQEKKVCPKGYYGRIRFTNNMSAFTSNANFKSYISQHANALTFRG